MKTLSSRTQMPWPSLGLLTALLVLSPFAMNFAPDPASLDGEFFHGAENPVLSSLRAALVIFGLVATVIAFVELVRTFVRSRWNFLSSAPSFSTFLACAVLGWRSFPYWVMGVYQVQTGAFPARDQDPKSLIPMSWIGDLWRLPVIFLHLLSYVALPGLGILVILLLWRRQYAAAAVTAGCASVSLLFMMAFSPNYTAWLMD